MNAESFIMEVASQLRYARKHGNKYDKAVNGFIMQICKNSKFVLCAENMRYNYDKIVAKAKEINIKSMLMYLS